MPIISDFIGRNLLMWIRNKEKKEKLKGLEIAIILAAVSNVSEIKGVTKS